jgi:CubicO group peptidase (beta-lactamase class C family)
LVQGEGDKNGRETEVIGRKREVVTVENYAHFRNGRNMFHANFVLRHMLKMAAALLICLSPSAPGFGQSQDIPSEGSTKSSSIQKLDGSKLSPQQADREIIRLMAAAKVTGLAVAVINRGELVYLKTFGWRDVNKKEPLTPDTIMYGASFTKSMFAYMTMQLVEEDVLDLDTPVYKYLPKPLPEYERYVDLKDDDRWKKLTPRILLSHTSGFPNWRFFTDDNKLKINFDPGTRYAYSGEGISLLQLAIEVKTNQDTGDMMQKRVFDRFHMSRTAMTWQPAWESNFAKGYNGKGDNLGHNKRSSPRAAGSMDTTITDVARFVQVVIRREGLKPQSWNEMFSPQIAIHSKHQFPSLNTETTAENDKINLSYGLGWGLFWAPYGKAIFKEGHDDGWENHMVIYDQQKSAVILMSNSSNGDSIFKELLEVLAGDHSTPWEWEGYVPYQQLKNAVADH